MRQKCEAGNLVSSLLQTIDTREIADELIRRTVEILLNLIEQQQVEIKELREENQKLRDENNRLKGEQGKPDIKGNKKERFKNDHSSEKERKTPTEHNKRSKNETIKVNREEIITFPKEKLPPDAEFKGYVRKASRREEVIVQDILLKTDNILFRKQKYYSPSLGKTYLAPLPTGYDGEFGPGIKALVVSLYYGGNMTQGKLLEFLEDIGISMSAGYLSNLLIKNQEDFETEYKEIYTEGLASSPWQHFDQTGARVGGVNHTTNVICNQLDERKRLTFAKAEELLLVLEHPELPLHNNPAELAARTMVQRRKISYATQTELGTKAWDIFMSLVATTRKLGVSFFEYVRDRILKIGNIPCLANIIRDKSSSNPFGWSWQPE